jgi:glutathione S-transferase
MNGRPTLIAIPYSPWSERADWALHLRGIAIEKERYSPILGELRLRRLRRGAPGPASVPVLVAQDRVIADSTDIARWADSHGDGPRLFPDDPRLAPIVEAGDTALDAGRALALRRTLADGDALLDLVPTALRGLGPVARWVAGTGVRRTLRKYGAAGVADVEHRERLRGALTRLREALAAAPAPTSGPKTLLGALSYADVAATQALVFIAPPEPDRERGRGIRIAKASRRAFYDADLAREFADLVAWRDAIYASYR